MFILFKFSIVFVFVSVSVLVPDDIVTMPPTSLVPLPAEMDILPPVVDPAPEVNVIEPPAPFVD